MFERGGQLQPFDGSGRYYDLLYRDKDYFGEAAYVDTLLRKYGDAPRTLLDLGSGTGRYGRLLAELGYQVTGVERNAEMVARAGATQGFRCQQGDIRSVSLGEDFDGVLALFHVVSYQIENADVQAVFARVEEHLRPGGVFIFDCWYSPAVYRQQPQVRVKRICDDSVEITRIAEPVSRPNDCVVDVNYTIFARERTTGAVCTFSESHAMRHFALPEIRLLAGGSGLEFVTAEGFLTGLSPGEETWGLCVILRKP